MHVHLFSCDHDFADQALRDGLPFFKRELCKICPQQLAKGRGIVDHLLPLDVLLACGLTVAFPAQSVATWQRVSAPFGTLIG